MGSREAIQSIRRVERRGGDCLAVEYPSRTYIYLVADEEESRAVALWEEVDGTEFAVRSKWDFIHAATELEERFGWTTVLHSELTQVHRRRKEVAAE